MRRKKGSGISEGHKRDSDATRFIETGRLGCFFLGFTVYGLGFGPGLHIWFWANRGGGGRFNVYLEYSIFC